tara:strand:- start:20 stop:1459 length:1440 start_codon:yes stop_codon:yes gene_type:complete
METLQRTANRGSVSTGPYEIDNSLKFESDNSEYIARTPSSAGNRKTWTLSFWIKRTELADGSNSNRVFEAWDGSTGTSGLFTSTDTFILDLNAGSNYFTSTQVFRDTAAWYHFVIRVDTTSGTASERARVYVNGSELAGSWNSNIGQNTDLTWNQDVAHNFARFHNNDGFVNAYYAEIINVDGTSLAPTAFGEVDSDSGIWIPKNASVTYGTNGFKLEFKSSGSLGADTSGNSNTWTLNNITAADQATDTPTNNFCTGNNLVRFTNPGSQVITEGGTRMTKGANGWETISGTIYVTRGKWYCEVQSILNSATTAHCSVMPDDSPIISAGGAISNYPGSQSGDGGIGYYANNGNKYLDGGNSSYGDDWKSGTGLGDIMGIALDMDNGKVYFAKANVWQNSGDPTSGATGTGAIDLPYPTKAYTMAAAIYANNNSIAINYGGYTYTTISSGASDANGHGTFEYAPPSGYFALCTKNLAEFG